jgi:hypothetical protein
VGRDFPGRKPFALSDNTISSTPVCRRCSFVTIFGSNIEPDSFATGLHEAVSRLNLTASRRLIGAE